MTLIEIDSFSPFPTFQILHATKECILKSLPRLESLTLHAQKGALDFFAIHT